MLVPNYFVELEANVTDLAGLSGLTALTTPDIDDWRVSRSRSFLERRSRHLLQDLRMRPERSRVCILTSESRSRRRRGAPTFGAVFSRLTETELYNTAQSTEIERQKKCRKRNGAGKTQQHKHVRFGIQVRKMN